MSDLDCENNTPDGDSETVPNNTVNKQRRKKRLLGGCCCLLVTIVVSLLIAYGVRLGTDDEVHTQGTLGTCRETTTDATTIKVMTLNTFLINCLPGVTCQEEVPREARVRDITTWFEDRDEDVVLFQEVWSYHDVLRDGMAEAGFCHYVMTERSSGSGLAIFSKHPIENADFSDWFDAFGMVTVWPRAHSISKRTLLIRAFCLPKL